MAPQLCKVCCSIPSDFWLGTFDQMEYCQEPFVELQSFNQMRTTAAKGCELCAILLKSPYMDKMNDENTTLYLRRSLACPERAVTLGKGAKGALHLSRTFFYRIPGWWWDMPVNLRGAKSQEPRYTVHRPTSSADPTDNLDLMKTWMRVCHQSHTKCSKNTTSFLPTRLLDLQAFSSGTDVRMVSSASIIKSKDANKTIYARYLTLSHCWGPPEKHSLKTTRKNLATNMTRISISSLSKTFADSIRVTRELGFRYLWIDSLCIVQDDRDDWAKEAALMADVYGNAYCTLAALSSKDGTEGCNLVPNVAKTKNCSFVDLRVTDGRESYSSFVRVFEREPIDWAEELSEGKQQRGQSGPVPNPLRFRAWTLQEDELSRRIIFFAKDQLLWKCCEQKSTAQLPWMEKQPADPTGQIPWPSYDGVDKRVDMIRYTGIRDQWYQLVEDYSLRSLTNHTDKLPAFAGLARKYQSVYPDAPYAAGMWGVHTPYSPDGLYKTVDKHTMSSFTCATLLWRSVDSTASRYATYTAPTWSWASVKGRVSYDSQRIEPANMYEKGSGKPSLSNCDFGSLQWGPMRAVPSSYDAYGAIQPGASLVLNGAVLVLCDGVQPVSVPAHRAARDRVRARIQPVNTVVPRTRVPVMPPELDAQPNADGELLVKDRKVMGVFYRDTQGQDDEFKLGRTYCLRVRGESIFSHVRHVIKTEHDMGMKDTAMGLMLVRTTGGYRRIGLARWVTESVFAGTRPVTITLV